MAAYTLSKLLKSGRLSLAQRVGDRGDDDDGQRRRRAGASHGRRGLKTSEAAKAQARKVNKPVSCADGEQGRKERQATGVGTFATNFDGDFIGSPCLIKNVCLGKIRKNMSFYASLTVRHKSAFYTAYDARRTKVEYFFLARYGIRYFIQ